MPSPKPSRVRLLLYLMYAVASLALALADVGLELVRFPAREPVAEEDPAWAPSPVGALRSGADGSFGADVAPGCYRIRIDDPGYNSSDGYQVVVGDGGQTPAPLVIAAHRLRTLEVVIGDEAGAGVVGAAGFIKDGDPGRAFYTPQRNGMATTDGNRDK